MEVVVACLCWIYARLKWGRQSLKDCLSVIEHGINFKLYLKILKIERSWTAQETDFPGCWHGKESDPSPLPEQEQLRPFPEMPPGQSFLIYL